MTYHAIARVSVVMCTIRIIDSSQLAVARLPKTNRLL